VRNDTEELGNTDKMPVKSCDGKCQPELFLYHARCPVHGAVRLREALQNLVKFLEVAEISFGSSEQQESFEHLIDRAHVTLGDWCLVYYVLDRED
jgi:hypothetical protein